MKLAFPHPSPQVVSSRWPTASRPGLHSWLYDSDSDSRPGRAAGMGLNPAGSEGSGPRKGSAPCTGHGALTSRTPVPPLPLCQE